MPTGGSRSAPADDRLLAARRTPASITSEIPIRPTAASPSNHQWLAVAITAQNVRMKWAGPMARHLLDDADQIPKPTIAAHATWMLGMAANWSEAPVPTGP